MLTGRNTHKIHLQHFVFLSCVWMSNFKSGCAHLLLKRPRFFSGQPQQEVVADCFAKHRCFFSPCVADYVTCLSVVGCDWDHKNQERALLLTVAWFVQYETVLVRVCHKVWWCWSLCRLRRLVFFEYTKKTKWVNGDRMGTEKGQSWFWVNLCLFKHAAGTVVT